MLETFFQNSSSLNLLGGRDKYKELVLKINAKEPDFAKLNDDQLRAEVQKIRQELLNEGMSNKVIIHAFALVREATKRVLGLRHYDVQLIGGLVLNEGKIAEMKTGEGKTIVALLPTFLNALYGKGVHVITVNDYLARRDAEYVGRVHRFLGLTVGLIQEEMETAERQVNYRCDVIYLTNNQLGFDYLRDNLAFTKEEIVQRPLFYCVVDEIDSVLIDEARTPLIISGSTNVSTEKYEQSTKLAAVLEKNIHYLVDEKNQIVTFLEDGIQFCEQALNVVDLYNADNPWIPYLLNSIKAKELFKLNTHYILNDINEIIIVDEFTGRTMEGRRWGDGLHQAVEAKENVPIQDETQVLASITYQNLFLLYEKLAGMTGTAKTEELEFEKIYNLRTVQVPTNRAVKRKDFPDLIYKNQYLKWQAIAKECLEMNQIGRPALVGTTTIEKSELLAALLSEYGVSYRLLNAKPENVESEAEIIAQAGCLKAVTISTNMAGRGTDITLGGNIEYLVMAKLKKFLKNLFATNRQKTLKEAEKDEVLSYFVQFFKNLNDKWYDDPSNFENVIKSLNDEVTNDDPDFIALKQLKKDFILTQQPLQQKKRDEVLALGGLHVIGTERHESRRIDNQLRGRAGRQGDKGSSRFFLSLDDRLVRLFGGQKIGEVMESMGLQDETPMQSTLLNQSLDSAQKKVENYYFDARKQLFEYDQALTMQRNGIYLERNKVLNTDNLRDWLLEYGERSLYDLVMASNNLNNPMLQQQFLIKKLQELLGFPYYLELRDDLRESKTNMEFFKQQFEISYSLKELQSEIIKPGLLRELERALLLQQVDKSWQQHLQKIDFLRDSIRWRAYGQRNPLTDYKKESYNLFVKMVSQIRHRVVFTILRSKLLIEEAV